MSVAFDGMDNLVVTFRCSGTVEAGSPVILSANDTVADGGGQSAHRRAAAEAGELRGGTDPGYVTLPYTGTAPALGWQELVTNGSQGLRTVTTGEAGKACLVVGWTRRQAPWGCFFEQKGEGTMAYSYETVRLDKGMYGEAGHSFTQVLEKCDPSSSTGGRRWSTWTPFSGS